MTSQPDRKLKLTLEESKPPQQKVLDDAVGRAFKAILDLNPCFHLRLDGKMKRAA
jgi:hypothetical protein